MKHPLRFIFFKGGKHAPFRTRIALTALLFIFALTSVLPGAAFAQQTSPTPPSQGGDQGIVDHTHY